jgi:hypothetical protein
MSSFTYKDLGHSLELTNTRTDEEIFLRGLEYKEVLAELLEIERKVFSKFYRDDIQDGIIEPYFERLTELQEDL